MPQIVGAAMRCMTSAPVVDAPGFACRQRYEKWPWLRTPMLVQSDTSQDLLVLARSLSKGILNPTMG
jgi:hypothetical protein